MSQKVRVNTQKTEEVKEKEQEQNTAQQQSEPQKEASDQKKSTKKKKYVIFRSPVAIGTKVIEEDPEDGKENESDDGEKKPTFKEKFHKFVNGLGTVALIGGIGLAAYGDYKMKKAKEEQEEDGYPCEDDDCPPEQYDPEAESEEDEED